MRWVRAIAGSASARTSLSASRTACAAAARRGPRCRRRCGCRPARTAPRSTRRSCPRWPAARGDVAARDRAGPASAVARGARRRGPARRGAGRSRASRAPGGGGRASGRSSRRATGDRKSMTRSSPTVSRPPVGSTGDLGEERISPTSDRTRDRIRERAGRLRVTTSDPRERRPNVSLQPRASARGSRPRTEKRLPGQSPSSMPWTTPRSSVSSTWPGYDSGSVLTTSTRPGRPGRLRLPGLRVADDHVGEVRAVQRVAVGALEVDHADLLDHAVEVVDAGQPGVGRERAGGTRRCRRPGRPASSSRRSGSGCRWSGRGRRPGPSSYRYSHTMNVKPKIRNGVVAVLGQERRGPRRGRARRPRRAPRRGRGRRSSCRARRRRGR